MAEGGSKLSEEHIFECLKSLSVPVRMNDLKVPTREFIVRVFDCFIKDLEIDITGHELRSWEATNHFEDGEIYEEGMYLTLLAMAVNHITNPCGLNITIKDIVEPKPKRTKKILNYLLVFWKYYLQKCARFHTIENTFEEEKRRTEDLIIENQSLDERYNDKLDVLNSMQPSKSELSEVVAALEQSVSKLKMESDTIGTDYQGMKTKEANLRNEISAIAVRIVTAKQTIEDLEQLILSSPERINTEIQKIEDKIKAEDLKIKEIENKCKGAEKKLKLQEEYKIEEEKDVKTLGDLTDTINHLENTIKSIVSCHQKIEEEEDSLKRIQLDVNRKEETKFQQEQKSAKIVLSSKKQIETLKEVLAMNLNKEACEKDSIEILKAANCELQKQIDSETNDILNVIAKCKEVDARSRARKSEYMTKMKKICSQFRSDCDEVLGVIKKTFPYDLEKNFDDML